MLLWYLKNKESKIFYSIYLFVRPLDVLRPHRHDHSNSTSRTFSIKRMNHHDFPLSSHWWSETSFLGQSFAAWPISTGASRHPNVKGETPFNGGRTVRNFTSCLFSFLFSLLTCIHIGSQRSLEEPKYPRCIAFAFHDELSPSKRTLQTRTVYWIRIHGSTFKTTVDINENKFKVKFLSPRIFLFPFN